MTYVDGPDNTDRAGWAAVALTAFGAETGQTGYDYTDPECLDEIAGDLICDVLHLARQAGIPADALIERARGHFDQEVADEDDGTYDHVAVPDDLPEPGDRCRTCGEDIVWRAVSGEEWTHTDDVRNR